MSLKSLLTPTIKPGDDFYHYVNKKWIDEHPIPANKSSIGTFTELSDQNLEDLKTALESTDTAPYNIQLARDFYRQAMDEAAIERNSLRPIQPLIDRINGIESTEMPSHLSLRPMPRDVHCYGMQALSRMIKIAAVISYASIKAALVCPTVNTTLKIMRCSGASASTTARS
jgi:hypothetical protein